MHTYQSGDATIRVDQYEPTAPGTHPALLLLHGSGGAVTYWLDQFAPALTRMGIATYAPHYFDRTGTQRATAETILDGKHFPAWLAALEDAISYVAARPGIDARRIGVLGISLGGYLAMALAVQDRRIRAVIELSAGIPPEWATRVSPAMPPVLIMHGTEDSTIPVSEAHKLQRLLEEHGVVHQMELLSGETHWFSYGVRPRLLMACAGFLLRYL